MLKASLKSHWPPQVGRRPELGKEHARTLAGAGFIAPFTQSAHLDQFLVHAKAGTGDAGCRRSFYGIRGRALRLLQKANGGMLQNTVLTSHKRQSFGDHVAQTEFSLR